MIAVHEYVCLTAQDSSIGIWTYVDTHSLQVAMDDTEKMHKLQAPDDLSNLTQGG
jgi:hypothetical protein